MSFAYDINCEFLYSLALATHNNNMHEIMAINYLCAICAHTRRRKKKICWWRSHHIQLGCFDSISMNAAITSSYYTFDPVSAAKKYEIFLRLAYHHLSDYCWIFFTNRRFIHFLLMILKFWFLWMNLKFSYKNLKNLLKINF